MGSDVPGAGALQASPLPRRRLRCWSGHTLASGDGYSFPCTPTECSPFFPMLIGSILSQDARVPHVGRAAVTASTLTTRVVILEPDATQI